MVSSKPLRVMEFGMFFSIIVVIGQAFSFKELMRLHLFVQFNPKLELIGLFSPD